MLQLRRQMQQLEIYSCKQALNNKLHNHNFMQQSSCSAKQAGTQKFIKLMRNLTQLIIEDPSHRQTIYEHLNSQQIKRLFQSIHDQNTQIRMTAIIFLSQLLYNNPRIIELIGVLEGYEAMPGTRKYIMGGLSYYNLQPNELKQIVTSLNKIKYQPNVVAWAIHASTAKIQYYTSTKGHNPEPFLFDPNQWIVGVFVRGDEGGQSEKRISTGNGNRYKIAKK